MKTVTKVAGFVVALIAVFALMFVVGHAFGPDQEPASAASHSSTAH